MWPLLESFVGEDNGEDPFFNDEPLDNLSPPDLSDPPEKAERKLFIPEPLLIEDKLPDFAATTALSKTNLR